MTCRTQLVTKSKPQDIHLCSQYLGSFTNHNQLRVEKYRRWQRRENTRDTSWSLVMTCKWVPGAHKLDYCGTQQMLARFWDTALDRNRKNKKTLSAPKSRRLSLSLSLSNALQTNKLHPLKLESVSLFVCWVRRATDSLDSQKPGRIK